MWRQLSWRIIDKYSTYPWYVLLELDFCSNLRIFTIWKGVISLTADKIELVQNIDYNVFNICSYLNLAKTSDEKIHRTFTSCYNIQLIGKYLYMLFSLNFGLFRVLRFLPTNKADRQDITEMLKVALSTINQPLNLVLNGAYALLKGK